MCSLAGPEIRDLQTWVFEQSSNQDSGLLILDSAVESIVDNIEKAAFVDAFSGDALRSLLWEPHCSTWASAPTGEDLYNSVRLHILSFVDPKVCEDGCAKLLRSRRLLVMAVGVASLLAFWQANVTGPSVNYPPCPLPILSDKLFSDEECTQWAKKQLMVDGCDLLGSCSLPQYLILAKILLWDTLEARKGNWEEIGGELSTSSWWACRALLAHQKILAERSASLYSALTELKSEMLKQLGSIFSLLETFWKPVVYRKIATLIATAVQLECGLVEYAYSHVDNAREQLEAAKEACGLELYLTGVLGFRTAHQVDPKAQMVLIANTHSEPDTRSPDQADKSSSSVKKAGELFDVGSENGNPTEDILMIPKLVASEDSNEPSVLSSIQQAVILAQSLDIKKSTPDDELKGWQMAPYIEAVDAQRTSHFMVKCCCQLFRIRWECTRSRTRERALLMMEQLVEEIRGNADKGQDRMCYAFCVNFPILPVLLKEYAELMISCGMIRDALRIFEELELWNNLIDCYCLLGKKAAAMDLIKERLQFRPEDPRLWCALGDVTLNEECYAKAWEVSGHRFARAQRSLGQSAYNKGEYTRSMRHWEAALALNSLHPRGWFALGSASLKARELGKSLDSYTRAVQLDPDDGEAWNNIAAIHMMKNRSKEAYTAFGEALKYRRSSWQMWENYAHVALDIKKFGQSIEALHTVLELTQGKRVNLDCLTKLMDEIEAIPDSTEMGVAEVGSIKMECNLSNDVCGPIRSTCLRQDARSKEDSRELKHEVYLEGTEGASSPSKDNGREETHLHLKKQQPSEKIWLIERVGKLLSKVVQNCQDGAVWGLLARWHRVKGDLTMCSEALLKQVRSLQGSDWKHNRDRFQKLCQVSLQLSKVYMDIALKSGTKRELYSAQMLLRNLVKQGENFANTDDYVALESFLKRIQLHIHGDEHSDH